MILVTNKCTVLVYFSWTQEDDTVSPMPLVAHCLQLFDPSVLLCIKMVKNEIGMGYNQSYFALLLFCSYQHEKRWLPSSSQSVHGHSCSSPPPTHSLRLLQMRCRRKSGQNGTEQFHKENDVSRCGCDITCRPCWWDHVSVGHLIEMSTSITTPYYIEYKRA